jgi:hypothetical protein
MSGFGDSRFISNLRSVLVISCVVSEPFWSFLENQIFSGLHRFTVFFTKVKYQNKIYQLIFFFHFIYSQKALSIIVMTPGKIINSQIREVIAKVIKFMKEEATNGIQIPVANFKARV